MASTSQSCNRSATFVDYCTSVGTISANPKSTNPLVVSLSLELLSRYIRRAPPPSATLERNEYARRDRDILWYLLRGSVWQSYTRYGRINGVDLLSETLHCLNYPRPKLESFADRTTHTPILGLMSAFVKDWIPLIDEYYYCKASIRCPCFVPHLTLFLRYGHMNISHSFYILPLVSPFHSSFPLFLYTILSSCGSFI